MSENKGVNKNRDKQIVQQGRRKVIKALAGIPVLSFFGWEVFKKVKFDKENDNSKKIVENLKISDIQSKVRPVEVMQSGNLLRIGIIGSGSRGITLIKNLGFMNKKDYHKIKDSGHIVTQKKHGNLNVAIIGVCDVFDLHAERALDAASFDIYTEGKAASKHKVKRYLHYQDMLNDKDIDAVIIATPDHHHARMSIDAIKAGKHVYCEKAPVYREEEAYELYDVVKNNNLVYQLGHQVPHNAVFQQAKEIIDKNLLGQISYVFAPSSRNTPQGAWIRHLNSKGKLKQGSKDSIDWEQWLGDSKKVPFSIRRYYSWARYFDYGTGLLGQLFSHEYDAINQLLNIGIPKSVTASGGQYLYKEFGDLPDLLTCAFEYPNKGLSLVYSANLGSSSERIRTIYGRDAKMTMGKEVRIIADKNSKRYAGMLKKGIVNAQTPMITIQTGSSKRVDVVTSATSRYYASRGLITTNINGQEWDVTYLHMKEWIDCIRNGGTTSSNIERAFEEGITIAMADISYRENCRTEWDSVSRKIIRK